MDFPVKIFLGLAFWLVFTYAQGADSRDDFELLPTGMPNCIFESSITRVVKNETQSLHLQEHHGARESDLSTAIQAACNRCIEGLKLATKQLRDKQRIYFFEDKCFFKRCSYGRSDRAISITRQEFGGKLSTNEQVNYCTFR